jgi:hypothetical protein
MNKTLNQRIYETPADIKKAIYDSGYEAGKKYATALIFAEIDRLHLHVANEYEARAYEELKEKYGVK